MAKKSNTKIDKEQAAEQAQVEEQILDQTQGNTEKQESETEKAPEEEKTPEEEKVSEKETSEEAAVSPYVERLMKLYPQYKKFWVTKKGFVHPEGVPEHLTKGATLYTNKYYNK